MQQPFFASRPLFCLLEACLRPATAMFLACFGFAQGTYVIDASRGPGYDYASLTEAIEAVEAGAILRIRPGVYPSLPSQGWAYRIDKPLTILGDPNGGVQLHGYWSIADIQQGESFVLKGVEVQASFPATHIYGPPVPVLAVEDCLGGSVWVEDCIVKEGPVPQSRSMISVHSSDGVLFVRVHASAISNLSPTRSRSALAADGASYVHIFESQLTGGRGSVIAGGAGVVLEDSFLYAYASHMEGGTGYTSAGPFSGPSTLGGTGLEVVGVGGEAVLVASTLAGGVGGAGVGAPSLVMGGSLSEVSIALHTMSVGSIAPPLASMPVSLTAPPGTFGWVLASTDPATDFIPAKLGVQAVEEASYQVVALGTVDGSGVLAGVLPAYLSSAPPRWRGFGGDVLYVQPFFFDAATGNALLATPSAVLLDVIRPQALSLAPGRVLR